MYTLSQMTWMTIWGLSFLFVGGFVLWVYGAQKSFFNQGIIKSQDGQSLLPHQQLVPWFVLYGKMAIFAGAGLLLTAAVALI
ncbi:MAG: hypothetical protein WC464_01845 [Bdellovibrionales bacterium]